jgi:hypothetical protein
MNRTLLIGASLATALSFLALAAAPAQAHVASANVCERFIFSWFYLGFEAGLIGTTPHVHYCAGIVNGPLAIIRDIVSVDADSAILLA